MQPHEPRVAAAVLQPMRPPSPDLDHSIKSDSPMSGTLDEYMAMYNRDIDELLDTPPEYRRFPGSGLYNTLPGCRYCQGELPMVRDSHVMLNFCSDQCFRMCCDRRVGVELSYGSDRVPSSPCSLLWPDDAIVDTDFVDIDGCSDAIPDTPICEDVRRYCQWCNNMHSNTTSFFCGAACERMFNDVHKTTVESLYTSTPLMHTNLPARRQVDFATCDVSDMEVDMLMVASHHHRCANARCPIALARRIYQKSLTAFYAKQHRTRAGVTSEDICTFYLNSCDRE